MLVDTASGQIAISLGIKGLNYAIVSACATGSHAIGEAAEVIKRGDADAVIAGGTEACVAPDDPRPASRAMRGLAAEDEDPSRASRPFDATRAGFVMSEGAGAVAASRTGSTPSAAAPTIYAEVLGYGGSNDAHNLAQPEPEAIGVATMMRRALERAGVEPERVGYINAHGTATPLGDAAETKAIKDVFGDHAYKLAVSSTKSMMGHTFGAAGAIEAIMCILALRDGVLPPTINYNEPDPECDLDYVPNVAREVQVDVALSNAMGLGGHNGCVLFGRRSLARHSGSETCLTRRPEQAFRARIRAAARLAVSETVTTRPQARRGRRERREASPSVGRARYCGRCRSQGAADVAGRHRHAGQPHAGRVEERVGDRGRDRCGRRLAGAGRRLVEALDDDRRHLRRLVEADRSGTRSSRGSSAAPSRSAPPRSARGCSPGRGSRSSGSRRGPGSPWCRRPGPRRGGRR